MKNKLSTICGFFGVIFAVFISGPAVAPVFAQTEETSGLITPGVAVDQASPSTTRTTSTNALNDLLPPPERSPYGSYEHAVIRSVRHETTETEGGTLQRLRYEVEILSGSYQRQIFTLSTNLISSASQLRPDAGDRMIVFVQDHPGNPEPDLFLESHDRQNAYIFSLVVLGLLLLIVAGGTGLKTMVIMGAGIWLSLSIALPLYLRGWPVWLAILVSVCIISGITVTLLHGWNKKSISALIGIAGSLLATNLMAYFLIRWGHLTGITNQTLFRFFQDHPAIQPEGLLCIGLFFATFGIIQDICLSITCGVSELKQLRMTIRFKELFHSGMQIGREHLATMGLILPLAWIGGSIWIFVFRYQEQSAWTPFFSQDQTAQILLLSIAGLIGVVCSIPLASAIVSAVWSAPGARQENPMRKAMGWKSAGAHHDDDAPRLPETSE